MYSGIYKNLMLEQCNNREENDNNINMEIDDVEQAPRETECKEILLLLYLITFGISERLIKKNYRTKNIWLMERTWTQLIKEWNVDFKNMKDQKTNKQEAEKIKDQFVVHRRTDMD